MRSAHWGQGVLALAAMTLGAWACPAWLTVATCRSNADCESGACQADGVCGVVLDAGTAACPECVTGATSWMMPGGQGLLAPHVDLLGEAGSVIISDRAGHVWRLMPGGAAAPLRMDATGYSSPVAQAGAQGADPAVVLLRGPIEDKTHLAAMADGGLVDVAPGITAAAGRAPVVVMQGEGIPLAVMPGDDGTVAVSSLGAARLQASSRVGAGHTHAAACAESQTVVLDSSDTMTTLHISPNVDGGVLVVGGTQQTSTLPGEPAFAPVVFLRPNGTLEVFSFRTGNGPNKVVHVVFPKADGGMAGLPVTSSLELPASMSGAPAGFLVGRVPHVAVPLSSGVLSVVWRDVDGELTAERWRVPEVDAGSPLGGVVALQLHEDDTHAALIVGDQAGWVHLVKRNARPGASGGWPFQVPGQVREPPLAVAQAGMKRARVLLAVETDGGALVEERQLGEGSVFNGALVWPEFQHDVGNSGCITLPAQ